MLHIAKFIYGKDTQEYVFRNEDDAKKCASIPLGKDFSTGGYYSTSNTLHEKVFETFEEWKNMYLTPDEIELFNL